MFAARPFGFRSPLDAIAAGIGMVHQYFMLLPPCTVVENIVFGAEPTRGPFIERCAALAQVAEFAERYRLALDPAAMVGDLPIGVQQRVEILKALYRDARILILDEPTAVLTPPEGDALFGVLRGLAAGAARCCSSPTSSRGDCDHRSGDDPARRPRGRDPANCRDQPA